jgi:hypothetical protein
MIYNTPTKGEDGLYFVKVVSDSKRKVLVQLNKVKISEVSEEIVFDLVSEVNTEKIERIDVQNLEAAQENCTEWFSKKLSENIIRNAYSSSVVNGQITGYNVGVTKVFNSQNEVVEDPEIIQSGKNCNVILEFSGLWFAKKAFGPTWNIVQVKVLDEPILDTYPDGYAFIDEEE